MHLIDGAILPYPYWLSVTDIDIDIDSECGQRQAWCYQVEASSMLRTIEQIVDMVIGDHFRLTTYIITQVNKLPRQLIIRRANVWSTSKRGGERGQWKASGRGYLRWDMLTTRSDVETLFHMLISKLESVGASSSSAFVSKLEVMEYVRRFCQNSI